jgi:hypothetical protein
VTIISISQARHLTLDQFQRSHCLANVHGARYVETLWTIYEHAPLATLRQAALDGLGRIGPGLGAA